MKAIKISHIVFQTLLLQSFRYCLGRMSYAVSNCVDTLELYWHELPIQWQKQIQEDIKDAIEKGCAGMDMDVRQWQKILELKVKE